MTSIIKKLPVLLLPFLISACSPRVITKVFRKSPEIVNPNQVHIVEIGDSIGDSYEVVGTVNITDKLLTARCGYDYVINLAKNETSKNGGNALALRKHKKPDIRSEERRVGKKSRRL